MLHDALIIAGSYAGMAAALQLARARRQVLVVDAGQRRNRFAAHSHGFLTQDGETPDGIAARARQQLLRYPTVTWIGATAETAAIVDEGFTLRLEDGSQRHGRRLVLATGVTDTLPALPGLRERWGISVFLCPYCDGYELAQGPLGVLATSDAWFHQAMLIPEWGPTTLFTQGRYHPDDEQRARLAARGVTIEATPVLSVGGDRATLQLADGRVGVDRILDLVDARQVQHVLQAGAHSLVGIDHQHRQVSILLHRRSRLCRWRRHGGGAHRNIVYRKDTGKFQFDQGNCNVNLSVCRRPDP